MLVFLHSRYYAQANFQKHVADIYRVAKNECGNIIQQVSNAIIVELKTEVMAVKESNWIRVANEFNYKWQLPNCVGAIDGKHIPIRKPHNAGSQYYNYKRFHSIVLMACVDANYRFICIDVGGRGAEGDGALFDRIEIGRMIKSNDPDLHLPPDAPVGNTTLPHFFIADDAFPLSKRLMKPYSGRRNVPLTKEEEVFNYRLSRARRCVENAFGIFSVKWACVNRTFNCQPDRVKTIVGACCLLHNFLLNRTNDTYIPENYQDALDPNGQYSQGNWRRSSQAIDPIPAQNRNAKQIRDALKEFVTSHLGAVSFQNRSNNTD